MAGRLRRKGSGRVLIRDRRQASQNTMCSRMSLLASAIARSATREQGVLGSNPILPQLAEHRDVHSQKNPTAAARYDRALV